MTQEGIVKWFSPNWGYGFIMCNNVEYFVFYANILMDGYKKLYKDQKVKFEVNADKQAINVKPI